MDSNRCRSRSRSNNNKEIERLTLLHSNTHTYTHTYIQTHTMKKTLHLFETTILYYTLLTFIYSIEQILSLFITIIIYCISRRRKKRVM